MSDVSHVSGSPTDLETRISTVLNLYPDRTSAAQASGKSTDMLIAYARGTSRAPFDALAGLAAGVGVSLDWLATGEGPMRRDQAQPQSQSLGQAQAQPETKTSTAQTMIERVQLLRGSQTPDSFAREFGLNARDIEAVEAGTSQDRRVLEAIATGVGVRLDWLLTGTGPALIRPPKFARPAGTPRPLAQTTDPALMGLCLEGLRAVYKEVNARINDRDAGALAARLHDDVMAATAGDPDPEPARRAAIRMGLQQLRRDLTAAPNAVDAGKHSA